MGGKTKQSQRIKNNARPSSSGRSAELLIGAGAGGAALFPSLAAPTPDPRISPELQLCFKKLNKKDPITKAKVLQELTELISNSKIEDVASALASWAHFYKILTADPDRKVRECTQACHARFVATCGRRVAPQLRALMPAWLQAQYDEHAPAQAHAANSLKKTFPDSKLPEVLSFCKEEILASLLEVLLGTGEACVRTGGAGEAGAAGAVERAAAGSLRALQHVARHLPAAHDAPLWAAVGALLAADAFWRRATHPDDNIRAAWYGALGGVAARFGGAVGARGGARALRALLGAREAAPLPAAAQWDCLLTFMHAVPDWHQYLEKKELLTKRILDLLECGGWGDARQLSQLLLPLLASLPAALLTRDFHLAFFNAIFVGLDKKSILSSKSERQYWITSLDECLRYVSTQPQEYVVEVVGAAHRTWLRRALAGGGALVRPSAAAMARLLKYWLRLANQGHGDKYDQLIRNFWQNVGSTLTAQIDNLSFDHDDIEKLIEIHILLLQTLKSSLTQEVKKQQSIRFEADAQPTDGAPPAESPPTDPAVAERYNHNLTEVVHNVCCEYLEFASEKGIASPVLSPLLALLAQWDGAALWADAARRLRAGPCCGAAGPCCGAAGPCCGAAGPCCGAAGLYHGVLRRWLADTPMRCQATLQLAFMLLKHLTDEEQDAVFDTFQEFPPSVVEWCIALALSHPHRGTRAARRWLRGGAVADAVRALCARLLRHGDARARGLLMLCLSKDELGERVVSAAAVEAALAQLAESLVALDCEALEARCAVAAQLATTLEPHARLLGALLSVTAGLQCGDARLSADTWREVRDAWAEGAAALTAAQRPPFLRDAALMLRRHADYLNPTKLSITQMEHIASLCPRLLRPDAAEAVRFSRDVLGAPDEAVAAVAAVAAPRGRASAEALAARHLALAGLLEGAAPEEPAPPAAAGAVTAYLAEAAFRVLYLRALCRGADEADEAGGAACDTLLGEEFFKELLCQSLYDFAIIRCLHHGYAFWPPYKIIEEAKIRLTPVLDDIIRLSGAGVRRDMRRRLRGRALAEGGCWAFASMIYEAKAAPDPDAGLDPDEAEAIVNSIRVQATDGATNLVFDENDSVQKMDDGETKKTEESEIDQTLSSENNQTVDSEDEQTANSEEERAADSEAQWKIAQAVEDILDGAPPAALGAFHVLQARLAHGPASAHALGARFLLVARALRRALGARVRGALPARREGAPAAGGDWLPRYTDLIVDTYYAHNDLMLYELDVSECAWELVAGNATICDFLVARVRLQGWRMAAAHWDFTNITLCSLLTSLRLSRRHWHTVKVGMVSRAALDLFLAVATFVGGVAARSERERPAAHVAALPREWDDIYAPDLHHSLLDLMLHLLESEPAESVSCAHVSMLSALAQCCAHVQYARLVAAQRACMTPERVARACVGALQRPSHHAYKQLAHSLLGAMLKPLVLQDAETLKEWSSAATEEDAEPRPLRLSLSYYDAALTQLQDVVTTALGHVRECEEVCELVAFSDAHSLALGWLLLADLVNRQGGLARGDLAHHYLQAYRERRYTAGLLACALRLLPEAVLAQAAAAGPSPQHDATTPRCRPMFLSASAPDGRGWCGGEAVARLACRSVWWAVRGAGGPDARGWRGVAPHRHATTLDNIVRRYITPHVVKEEFTLLQKRATEIEDTEVSINRSAYEVTCVLTVDDCPITLTVELARQHPLVLPRLASSHPANNAWVLMYLGYQNGTLLNALKMWVRGVNTKLERAPQCYICYCRLHHATGRLPKVTCHTCKNKFHSVCVRKWFSTSNKTTCPLCRTAF